MLLLKEQEKNSILVHVQPDEAVWLVSMAKIRVPSGLLITASSLIVGSTISTPDQLLVLLQTANKRGTTPPYQRRFLLLKSAKGCALQADQANN
jgi:hypothetical protein